ncbi:hypothetical protein HMPREF9078_00864 [Capnocytophaga sp. oral taxon 380 str. F0488]|nr:hypothetical protein HMPREF9078_00864 [Capnocytophaga sp. oral taxon 380 str. F0488]
MPIVLRLACCATTFSKVEVYQFPSSYLYFSINLTSLFLHSLFIHCSSFVRLLFVFPISFL